MKLSNEDIRNYTTGAVRFQEDGSPVRMTETQDEKFTPHNPASFHIRCYNTSGIRIKLVTDGSKLSFTLHKPGKYAIMQNGLAAWSREYLPELKYPITVCLNLEKHEKSTVTFVFPNYQNGHITDIEFSDATYIEKYKYKRKFLFYGDSITQGMSADRPFMSYYSRVSEYFDAEILNQAISGSWFFPKTLEKVPFDPDVVIIGYGTNEMTFSPSIEDTDRRCKEYFKKIKEMYGDKKIIAISPIWRQIILPEKVPFFEQIKECVKKYVKEFGIILIDGYTLVPHNPYFFADGTLHPNNIGFSFYTENLIKQIQSIIEK